LANYDGSFFAYDWGPLGIQRGETTNVGTFPPNAFGLYDMHGNVYEWCEDAWHGNYNYAPTNGAAWESSGSGSKRVMHGGCWYNNPWDCRSANRIKVSAISRISNRGFRVVLVVPSDSDSSFDTVFKLFYRAPRSLRTFAFWKPGWFATGDFKKPGFCKNPVSGG
jgi:hypothetical protein